MKQVFIFHGGNSWSSYDSFIENLKKQSVDYERLKSGRRWRNWIDEQMPEADILLPTMPNGFNAQFHEWQIYFEKLIPYFQDDVRLVGHSLGGMFLAKYLQDSPLDRKVRQLILVAASYNDNAREELGSFEVTSATNLGLSAEEIHLFHSMDDFAVPFSELAKFEGDLPHAISHIFSDRGHFLDVEFPELLELLKQK